MLNGGQEHNFDSFLRLLRVHEFKAEQARYVVELLLETGVFIKDARGFLAIDYDNENMKLLSEHWERDQLLYLTANKSPADPEEEED